MRTLFMDFETYYDREYSLKKMTPVEYILDPRYETIGLAVTELGRSTIWIDGPNVQGYFDSLDPDDTCTVTFNALFDNCIMAWRYGFVPKLMIDMLGVCRALIGYKVKPLTLRNVSTFLGLPPKGTTINDVVGMRLTDIIRNGLYEEYVTYSKGDAENCEGAYDKLVRSGQFPLHEILVMDMVLRCTINPKFVLDQDILARHLANVQQKREQLLAQSMLIGVETQTDLRSNDKFAELLTRLGVDPPMKISPTTGKPTFALSKKDPEFVALQDHDNPAVQVLIAARMGHKSTLEETRTQKLIRIANLTWPGNKFGGRSPMPLRYGGAHTHRLSGDWGINVQNMPSRKDKTLRTSLRAPKGHLVVAPDAAQIEARIVAWLCGQEDLVQQFENGDDVYAIFAESVFGHPVNKKEHPVERFIGKTGILGLGFGVGHEKFGNTVEVDSKDQLGHAIVLGESENRRIVGFYRIKHKQIPLGWRTLNSQGISALNGGEPFEFGPCRFTAGQVMLPSGLPLRYHDLRNVGGDWFYTYGRETKKIYGGKLLENISQALARIIVMDAGVRIQRRLKCAGIELALQVHDELVYVVPEKLAEVVKAIAIQEMEKRPSWAPGLPLKAEAEIGPSYGEAK